MDYKFFGLFIIFFILCSGIIVNVKGLIGQNVRLPDQNEFPSVVCITIYEPEITTNENLLCTGTLISESLILTNEHCFQNTNITMIEIIIQNSIYRPELIYYPIWWIDFHRWVILNPEQNQRGYNDVAVVKIYGILSYVVPAILSPINPIDMIFGLDTTMVGCGRSTISHTPPTLKTGIVQTMSRLQCSMQLSQQLHVRYRILPGLICSQSVPCTLMEPGDSGGPLFFQGLLVAINVGLYPPANMATGYNRVNAHIHTHKYMVFITTHVNLR